MEMPEIDDERKLLAETAGGDHRAFRYVFDSYRNKVYTYAYRYLKSKESAEEIVQEVFLKIWMNKGKLTDINNFGGYLRTITNNQTLDYLKKLANDFKLVNNEERNWSEVDEGTQIAIYNKDSQYYIDQMIAKLPKQQQLVYKMCKIDGLKQQEVAEKLGISPNTIKVHLREAIKNLKMLLKDSGAFSMLTFIFLGMTK